MMLAPTLGPSNNSAKQYQCDNQDKAQIQPVLSHGHLCLRYILGTTRKSTMAIGKITIQKYI